VEARRIALWKLEVFMKLLSCLIASAALVATAGVAQAQGYGSPTNSRSKSFFDASSNSGALSGQLYLYAGLNNGKGYAEAFSQHEHNDYAEQTKYGVKAGGNGFANNGIRWNNGIVIGVGGTFAGGQSSAVIGGQTRYPQP
jgi:hypothetical protein